MTNFEVKVSNRLDEEIIGQWAGGCDFNEWMNSKIEGYVSCTFVNDQYYLYHFDTEENANIFKMKYLT